MTQPEDTETKPATGALAKAVGKTFLSMTVTQSRLLLLQLIAYLGTVLAGFVALENLKPHFASHPILSSLFVFGMPFYLVVFSTAPQFWQRYRQARRNAIALTPNPELPLNARYFRLDHYVCATPEEFHRDDGAHLTILEWIRNANQAILFLSGVSGAGKSSVLAGYVLPMLEKDNIRIERIRSSADPLSQLQGILATRRPKNSRLLIVFDQFEEFIILEDLSSEAARREFIDYIRALRESPPPGVCLLFTFRRDYMSEMISMEFAELVPGKSFMEVDTFKRIAARRFLEKALSNSSLIDKLLAGAEQLDDVPARFRPVTLNMLGIALQDFDGEVSRQPERLVQGYMEAALCQPDIREVAPQVVVQMISDANTKKPSTVAALASLTGLAQQDILACLILLEQRGLARRLDAASGLWELSHDFVARQFALLLARLRPNRWPAIGMGVMASLFVFMLAGAVIGTPQYLENQARVALANLQVSLIENKLTGVTASFDLNSTTETITKAMPYLTQLGINTLNLSGTKVTTLPPLDKLTALQTLDLSGTKITTLPPLEKLTALQWLNLSGTKITTLPPLGKQVTVMSEKERNIDISQ